MPEAVRLRPSAIFRPSAHALMGDNRQIGNQPIYAHTQTPNRNQPRERPQSITPSILTIRFAPYLSHICSLFALYLLYICSLFALYLLSICYSFNPSTVLTDYLFHICSTFALFAIRSILLQF